MNKSTPSAQYVIQPPTYPEYMFKRYSNPLRELIDWAKREHVRELRISSQRGYMKTVKYLTEEYSPIRILAEMYNFRKICSLISSEVWRQLNRKDQEFLIQSFNMREDLFRD